MVTRKKNAKDHRDRKNPRMHEAWLKQKKARNAAQRAARAQG